MSTHSAVHVKHELVQRVLRNLAAHQRAQAHVRQRVERLLEEALQHGEEAPVALTWARLRRELRREKHEAKTHKS